MEDFNVTFDGNLEDIQTYLDQEYFKGVGESPITKGEGDQRGKTRIGIQRSPLKRTAQRQSILEELNQSIIEETKKVKEVSGNNRGALRPSSGLRVMPYTRMDELKDFYGDRKPIDSLVKVELRRTGLRD
jgi:hypothetical protein